MWLWVSFRYLGDPWNSPATQRCLNCVSAFISAMFALLIVKSQDVTSLLNPTVSPPTVRWSVTRQGTTHGAHLVVTGGKRGYKGATRVKLASYRYIGQRKKRLQSFTPLRYGTYVPLTCVWPQKFQQSQLSQVHVFTLHYFKVFNEC
jgi:hypothetical protein